MLRVRETIEAMPAKLRAGRAAGINAVIQCEVGGENGGIWHGVFKGGALTVNEGPGASPRVTLNIGSRDWLAFAAGAHSWQVLFRTGKLKIRGDIVHAMKLGAMFQI